MIINPQDELTVGEIRNSNESVFHAKVCSYKPKDEPKSETLVLGSKEIDREKQSIADLEAKLWKKLNCLNGPGYDIMSLESKKKLRSEINDLQYAYSTFLISKPV